MKLKHVSEIPFTMAHDNLRRQRFIAPGEVKSQVQTVNYVALKPGQSYTPHTHPDCEEFFYILEGTAEATIAGTKTPITQGDFLVVEVGEEHVFLNNTKNVFKYFCFRVMI